MIVILDADVLLDIALNRETHADSSTQVPGHCERRAIRGFVLWHSLSNFYYIVGSEPEARRFLQELVGFVEVAPTSTEDFRYAARLAVKDLEDAMQVAAAAACGADLIVTRNVRDYTRSPIRAISPATLLRELA
ncbi:MAG: PIN domain-containing protein [Thermoanaerobaculia bacterium]|nr:PIN domain-containing protein [Thermoanaerobaculia bacterium]